MTKSEGIIASMMDLTFRVRTIVLNERNPRTTRLATCKAAFLKANGYLTNPEKDNDDTAQALISMLNCVGDWLGINVGKLMVEMGSTFGGAEAECPWALAKNIYPETITMAFTVEMQKAAGLCAKALESHDHVEPYPVREVLNEQMPKLLVGILACVTPDHIEYIKEHHEAMYSPLFVNGWGNL